MDDKIERRRENLREILLSAISIFIAGVVAFPPGKYNYWPSYPDYFQYGPIEIGHTGILVLMAVLSMVLGGVIAIAEDLRLSNFIIGGAIVYVFGMYEIEKVYSPSDSPVHFLVFGGAFIMSIIGAALAISTIREKYPHRIFHKLVSTSGS